MLPKKQKRRWGIHLWSKMSEARPWVVEFELSNMIFDKLAEALRRDLAWSHVNGDFHIWTQKVINNDT